MSFWLVNNREGQICSKPAQNCRRRGPGEPEHIGMETSRYMRLLPWNGERYRVLCRESNSRLQGQ